MKDLNDKSMFSNELIPMQVNEDEDKAMDESLQLNWIDLIIVIIVVGSTAVSLWRGFGREILSLLNFFAAFVIARMFSPQMSGLLMNVIDSPPLRGVAAFASLFMLSILVGGLIMRVASLLIKFGGLEVFDRLLGTVFGFLRGAVVVLVVIGTVNWGGWFVHTPTWRSSNLLPMVLDAEVWSRKLVRLWLFNNNMDGLDDTLMQQLDALKG